MQSFVLYIMSDSQDHPSSILYSQDTSEYERNKESVISEHQAQPNKGSLAVEMSENGQIQHEVNEHKGSLYIKKKEYEEPKEEEQQTNEHTIQKPVRYEGELISYSPQTSHISANNSTINVLANHVEIFNNLPVSSLMQYDEDQQLKQLDTVKSEEKAEVDNDNVEYSDEDYYRESYTSNTPVNSGIKREKKSQLVEEHKKVPQVDANANRYESQGSSEDQREKQQKQHRLKEHHELKKEKETVHVEYTQKKQEKQPNENYTNSSPEDSSQMLINLTKDKQAFKKQNIRNDSQYIQEINQSRNYLPNTGPSQYHQEEINQSKYSQECKLDLLANLKVVPVGGSQYSQKQVQRKLFQTNLDKDSLVIIEKKQDEYVAIQPSPSQTNMQSLRHQSMKIPKSPTKPISQIQQQPQGKQGKACSCQLI